MKYLSVLILVASAFAQFQQTGNYTITGLASTSTVNTPSTPSITTTSCPSGTQSVTYVKCTLAGTGGTSLAGNYCWTTDVPLPSGLSLSGGTIAAGLCTAAGTGIISGTPSTVQTVNFTATLTDANGLTAQQALSITITASPTLKLQSGTLPIGIPNSSYSALLSATGGVTPYTACSITAGALPSGLSIAASSSSGCTISGTVTAAVNTYNFTAQITDSASNTAIQSYSITVTNGAAADDNFYDNANGTCNGNMAASDGPAALPTKCFHTALSSTPSPGGFYCLLPSGQSVPSTCSGSTHNYTCTLGSGNICTGGLNTVMTDIGNGTIPCGSTVKLVATDTGTSSGNQIIYTDPNPTIPATTCDTAHYIRFETDMFANLPPEGSRISPAWAGIPHLKTRPNYAQPAVAGVYMPAIFNKSYSQPGVKFTSSSTANGSVSNSFRFIGIWFTQPNPTDCTLLGITSDCTTKWQNFNIDTNCAGNTPNMLACPNNIILDRVIIGPHDNVGTLTAADCFADNMTGQNIAIIDSYIFGINDGGTNNCEPKAINFGNTMQTTNTGPYKFINNYAESGGESIFSGGSVYIASTPCDVQVRRNQFSRPYQLWMPNQSSYLGTPVMVKNLGEFKNLCRALIEGNDFEYSYYGNDLSGHHFTDQFGQGLTLNSSVQSGTGPYRAFEDGVTVRFNLMQHMIRCMFIDSSASPGAGNVPPGKVVPYLQNISVHDNLCDDVNTKWVSYHAPSGGDGSNFVLENTILGIGTNGTINNINVSHNTIVADSYQTWTIGPLSSPPILPPLTIASISVAGTTGTLTAVTGPVTNLTANQKIQIWNSCAGFNQNASITAVTQQGTASLPAIFTYTSKGTGTCSSGNVSLLNTSGGTANLNEGASDTALVSVSESGTTATAIIGPGWAPLMCVDVNNPAGCSAAATFTIWGLTGSLACYNNNQTGCTGTTPATWTTTGFVRCSGAGTGTAYGTGSAAACTASGQSIVVWTHTNSGLSSGTANGGSYASFWSNFGVDNYGPDPNPGWQNITFYGNILAGRAVKAGGACQSSPCTTTKDFLANSGIVATSGPGAYVYNCNVQATQQLTGQTLTDVLPTGNSDTPDHTLNTIGFTNYNWDNQGQGVSVLGDLSLAASSPFKGGLAGCDGKDPGADIPSVISYTTGVIYPVDMAEIMMLTDRTNFFMAGTNSEGSWRDADNQKIWHIKCGSGCTRGYPWDIRKIDSNHINWWITDNSFTLDPSAYKRFVTPVPLVPRYFTPGTTVDTGELPGPNTLMINAGGGGCTETSTNLGHIRGITSGPFADLNFGGSVGQVPYYKVQYRWGGTNGSSVYNTEETYYFAPPYGLVEWTTASWNGTQFIVNQTSTFTSYTSGGAATPQFTCSNQSWWLGGQPGVGGNAP